VDSNLKINSQDKVALIGKKRGEQAEILDLENIDGTIEMAP